MPGGSSIVFVEEVGMDADEGAILFDGVDA